MVVLLTFAKARRIATVIEIGVNSVHRVWFTIERNINNDNGAAGGGHKNRIILALILTVVRVTGVIAINPIITKIDPQAAVAKDGIASNRILNRSAGADCS